MHCHLVEIERRGGPLCAPKIDLKVEWEACLLTYLVVGHVQNLCCFTHCQKRLPIKLPHHQCAVPGIDPIDSPHPRIQCSGPLQKDPHPEPASGRALTPSRTRFSSPLATAREQDGLVPTTFPEGTQPRRVPAQWARTSVYWSQSGA